MKKPMIGIISLIDYEKNSYWMIPGYLDGIRNAGGIPMILPILDNKEDLEDVLSTLDGVLLPGGQDVNPTIYHEAVKTYCGQISNERDQMESFILDYAYMHDIPLLGICRGIQFMNAHFGGSLYQDLPIEHASMVEHHMNPPYDSEIHQVKILKDSKLSQILKKDTLGVNSYHHQAIDKLAPNLEAMAISEDGLIEAVEVKNKTFMIAVQWHPELSLKKEASQAIFKAFIDATKNSTN